MFIYMLLNKINGKVYVGQTVRDVNDRLRQHKVDGARRAKNLPITLAIHKYGWSAFEKFVLGTAQTQEELNTLEQHWIAHYDCLAPRGYNLKDGGQQGGRMHEETKRKIGAARRGRKHTDESRARMSASSVGKLHSEETKAAMSKARAGEGGSNAKLDWETVGEIRRRFAEGDGVAVLADTFDVSDFCVGQIVYGKTWRVEGMEYPKEPKRDKLTPEIVKAIFIRRKGGESGAGLAREFDVSEATVSCIASGKKWKEVTMGL
jgi:group I intron endonuclease